MLLYCHIEFSTKLFVYDFDIQKRFHMSLQKYLHWNLRKIKPSVEAATSSDVPQLPIELWMAIAEFIDPVELEKLIGVNRGFFEIAMDKRYTEVKLIEYPSRLLNKLDRLK